MLGSAGSVSWVIGRVARKWSSTGKPSNLYFVTRWIRTHIHVWKRITKQTETTGLKTELAVAMVTGHFAYIRDTWPTRQFAYCNRVLYALMQIFIACMVTVDTAALRMAGCLFLRTVTVGKERRIGEVSHRRSVHNPLQYHLLQLHVLS